MIRPWVVASAGLSVPRVRRAGRVFRPLPGHQPTTDTLAAGDHPARSAAVSPPRIPNLSLWATIPKCALVLVRGRWCAASVSCLRPAREVCRPLPRLRQYCLAGVVEREKTSFPVPDTCGIDRSVRGESHEPTNTAYCCMLSATAAVALPAVAHAEPPEITHGHFDDTFDDVDVCGIIVDIHNQGRFTDHVFFDSEGNFVRFVSTSSGTQTLTAENGKSVVIQFAQQYSDTDGVVDEAAGTITFVYTFKGLPEKISTPHGQVIVRDAGVITFADTFDLDTGDFISQQVLVMGSAPRG